MSTRTSVEYMCCKAKYCRHCDAQYPNPLRLRVHTREAHRA